MAELPKVFRAQDHESMADFTPVPKDDYMVQIVKSELKPTKAGNGTRLLMQEKIMEGDFTGRIVFVGLNIDNPSEAAVAMSMKELKSICDACGKPTVTNSEELHMIPHMISVDIKPADANWPEQNVIKKYSALEGTAAAAGDNPFGDDEG